MIALKYRIKSKQFFNVNSFFTSTSATLPYAGLSPLIAHGDGYQGQGEVWGYFVGLFKYLDANWNPPKKDLFLKCETKELGLQIFEDYKSLSISQNSTKKSLFFLSLFWWNNLGRLNLSVRSTHSCINHIIKSVCK